MKKLLIIFLFVAQNSFADCDAVTNDIYNYRYKEAQYGFINNCKGKSAPNIKLTIEERDRLLTIILNNFVECREHYRLKEMNLVKKCVDNLELKSALEKSVIPFGFGGTLLQKFNAWDREIYAEKYEKEDEEYFKQKAIEDKIEAQKIYKNGSDLVKIACGAKFAIDHHAQILKNRNRISSVYIAKYEHIIKFSKKILKEQKTEYLKRTGKPLNMAKCNN